MRCMLRSFGVLELYVEVVGSRCGCTLRPLMITPIWQRHIFLLHVPKVSHGINSYDVSERNGVRVTHSGFGTRALLRQELLSFLVSSFSLVFKRLVGYLTESSYATGPFPSEGSQRMVSDLSYGWYFSQKSPGRKAFHSHSETLLEKYGQCHRRRPRVIIASLHLILGYSSATILVC